MGFFGDGDLGQQVELQEDRRGPFLMARTVLTVELAALEGMEKSVLWLGVSKQKPGVPSKNSCWIPVQLLHLCGDLGKDTCGCGQGRDSYPRAQTWLRDRGGRGMLSFGKSVS